MKFIGWIVGVIINKLVRIELRNYIVVEILYFFLKRKEEYFVCLVLI